MERVLTPGGPHLILLLQNTEDKQSGSRGTHTPSHRTDPGPENARVSRTVILKLGHLPRHPHKYPSTARPQKNSP